MGEWIRPVTQWRCLGCGSVEGSAGCDLCRACEASEAEAWQTFDRVESDRDAAIETLRVFLLNHAETCARIKHPYHERRACIAIALALLL